LTRAAALLARAGEHGYRAELVGGVARLVPVVPDAKMPGHLVAEFKACRALVMVELGLCTLCGRVTEDAADRERLKDCVFCDDSKCPYKKELP
jgi:hypothetical protein